jgi:rhodanese-related sulfurtransferase
VSTRTTRYGIPTAIRRSSRRVEPDEARQLISQGALLVDVRRYGDDEAALEGARRIPPDEIPGLLGELPRDRPILLACT